MPRGVQKVTQERVQAHKDFVAASSARTAVTQTTAHLFHKGEFVGTAIIDMGPYVGNDDPAEGVLQAIADQKIPVVGFDIFVLRPNHYFNKPLHIRPVRSN